MHCKIFSSLLRLYLLAAILLQLWWSKNVLDLGEGGQILTSWGLLIQEDLKKFFFFFLLLLKNGFLNRWIHKAKCVLLFLLQRKNLATCSLYLSSKFSFIQSLINLMHGEKKPKVKFYVVCYTISDHQKTNTSNSAPPLKLRLPKMTSLWFPQSETTR